MIILANNLSENLLSYQLVQLRDPKNDVIFNFNFDDKMKNLWTEQFRVRSHYEVTRAEQVSEQVSAQSLATCTGLNEHFLSSSSQK